MTKFLWIYFGAQALLLIVLLIVARFKDRRYRNVSETDVPDGFERTTEVSIDPRTGQQVRVYYNPRTGERRYKPE
ncbi:hypothetical protein NQ117_19325 [Paenibacillus sp. SC116]|uniref:hypothetical protein n=1 Tax=Paenibacillus sp. SC116 TaxID=2968986 RepID=UPI00215A61B6|nr:hypothetical protein [Paenibacillus sp. SC116]MCR8845838.1 hypothetical protein [Paenibacillus sp. SC116]